jgi:copper chaperone CopZ
MNASKLLLSLLVLAAGGAAAWIALRTPEPTYQPPREVPSALASQPTEGELVRTLDVEGMCCGSCRPKVYDALAAVPGVREAAVEVGVAQAIVDAKVEPAELEKALTFDKYVAHAR